MKATRIIAHLLHLPLLLFQLTHIVIADEWEWAGVFDLDEDHFAEHGGTLLWTAEKVDGSYGDDVSSMRITVLETVSADHEGIESVEETADEIFAQTSVHEALHGSNISVGVLNELIFNDNSWISSYFVELPRAGHWAIFTEHLPSEFEASNHFLKTSDGEDVDPSFSVEGDDHDHDEESHSSGSGDNDDDDEPWDKTIPACLAVWACTVAGLLLLILPGLTKNHDFLTGCQWFASGALLSAAFSLILLESSHLIAERGGGINEEEVSGYWAAMVLCGFATPLIADSLLEAAMSWSFYSTTPCKTSPSLIHENVNRRPTVEGAAAGTASDADALTKGNVDADGVEMIAADAEHDNDTRTSGGDAATEENSLLKLLSFQEREAKYMQMVRVLSGVLIGDFFHNFCDGIFIGAAFQSCSTSVGWTVASATVFHELSQELADYVVLTTVGMMDSKSALLYNILSGFSVVLGGIVITAIDVSDFTVGMLLAFGAGQYIFVATVALMPCSVHSHNLVDGFDKIAAGPVQEPAGKTVPTVPDATAVTVGRVGANGNGANGDGAAANNVDTAERYNADNTNSGGNSAPGPGRKLETLQNRVVSMLSFVVGAVAVGLVLLDHEHCDGSEDSSSGSSGGHDGHNH